MSKVSDDQLRVIANLRSITSVEFQDGDGNTLAKIENPKRKSWERAPE